MKGEKCIGWDQSSSEIDGITRLRRSRYNATVPAPSRKGPWVAFGVWAVFVSALPPLLEVSGFQMRDASLANVLGLLNIAVILALIGWERRIMKRQLHRPGYCDHCGYDLRATPDRCPECGVVTEKGTSRAG
jgi:hypothetical protein